MKESEKHPKMTSQSDVNIKSIFLNVNIETWK